MTVHRRHPVLGALAAAVMAILALPTATPTAAAAPDDAPATITLVDQAFQLAADSPAWTASVRLPPSVEPATLGTDGRRAEIRLVLHERVVSQAAVVAAIGGSPGPSVDTYVVALDDPEATDIERPDPQQPDVVALTVPTVRSADAAQGSDILDIPRPGLYPVSVQVRVDGQIASDLLTFVELAGSKAGRGDLSVAFTMSPTIQPTVDVTGDVSVPEAGISELIALGDTLRQLHDLPASDGVVQPTIGIESATIRAIADEYPDLAASLFPLLAESDLVSSPRLPLDPSAAAEGEQASRYITWLQEGEDLVGDLVDGGRSARQVYLAQQPLSVAGATLLRSLGARAVVLAPDVYAELPAVGLPTCLDPCFLGAGYTPWSQLMELGLADGASLPTIAVDPDLSVQLDAPGDDPTLAAIRVVAQFVGANREIVSRDEDPGSHGFVVARSNGGVIDAGVAVRIAELVGSTDSMSMVSLPTLTANVDDRLVEQPVLDRASTDGDDARAGSNGGSGATEMRPVRLQLPDQVGPDITARADYLAQTGTTVEAAATMLASADTRVAGWLRILDGIGSTSVDDAQALRMIASINDAIDEVKGCVQVPADFSFQLTGSTSKVFFSLSNTCDVDVTVRVQLSSLKLEFPAEGLVQLLPANETTPIDVPVEARTNGVSPAELRVLTPGGNPALQLAPTVNLTANVTALRGLGPLITGVAFLLVLAWWAKTWRSTRRRRLAQPSIARHPTRRSASTDDDATSADRSAAMGAPGLDELTPDAAASSLPPS